MGNVLIVENNFNYCKKIINILSDKISEVKLCKIAFNEKEAIEILKNSQNNIDIILLDLRLNKDDETQLLNYIKYHKLEKFKSSIIVISNEMESILEIKNNQYIFSHITKSLGIDKIFTEIENLVKKKENEMFLIKYQIYNELKSLHYNFSYVGTKYLVETILLLYKKEYSLLKPGPKKIIFSVLEKLKKPSVEE